LRAALRRPKHHDQQEHGRIRHEVRTWIRNGDFDAVIDFDAAVRDPDHPTRVRPDYDVGDHLHRTTPAIARWETRLT
jgi:hypothetical protein